MARPGRRLAVSLPDTLLEEKDTLRDKTVKLGTVARACSIYGVDIIEVFHDPRGKGEAALMRKVLEYLETPQYLRKRLFPLDESLRFAGILPPLRIPSHRPKVPLDALRVGDLLEGVSNGDGTVDVGLDAPLKLAGAVPSGRRVTVKLGSARPPTAEVVAKSAAGRYWGYTVETKEHSDVFPDQRYDLKVGTSRFGKSIQEAGEAFVSALRSAEGVKLVFGAPSRGLYDIFGRRLDSEADFMLNLFPDQHVETVRTEEAIFAGLGLLSLLAAIKP